MKVSYKRRYCLGKAAKRYEKTEKGKIGRYRIRRRYEDAHQLEVRARGIVRNAIFRGKIKRAEICARCGKDESQVGRIQAHHPDYSEPYRFIWACRKCHRKLENSPELFLEVVDLRILGLKQSG